ncbi:hypothetical protein EZS27_011734 [termite gut metagenome]|uniref:DUF4133 domain-containing protein n=1 Tax=termite gut metagenome TaxID=433724 RepID=A0A5J4S4W1_9ZZZZ
MVAYSINKGIGRPAEFKGLQSQYLFLFAGGLLAVFVAFVIMYMIGIGGMFCIAFGLVTGGILVQGIFRLNSKYGEHGLMKVQAASNHPRYIINRLRIERLFNRIAKEKGVRA